MATRFPAPASGPVKCSGCGIQEREARRGGPPGLPLGPCTTLHMAHLVMRSEAMDRRCDVGSFCLEGGVTESLTV